LQVDFAEELVRRHLLGAAQELLDLTSNDGPPRAAGPSGNGASAAPGGGGGNGSGANGANGGGKERVRSLLQRMEGCLRGARSLLPDFAHARAPGEPLTVAGQARPPLPSPSHLSAPGGALEHCLLTGGCACRRAWSGACKAPML